MQMSTASAVVAYEQPLGERIRSFLRLEYLFRRARHEIAKSDKWSHRTALESLFDLMSLMGRSDVKKEIIKELERHATTLEALAKHPGVDRVRLEEILHQIKHFLGAMNVRDSAPGYELKFHEFLSTVRQRASLPAGTCDFDVPNLHFWLQNPPEQRAEDLARWLASFDIVSDSISLCLTLVRESVQHSDQLAEGGFYQYSLNPGSPCQLIQVVVDRDARVYPEISAGKHRFTIRFMGIPNTAERPIQTDQNVAFQLGVCVI